MATIGLPDLGYREAAGRALDQPNTEPAAFFTSDATFERGDLRVKGQDGLKRMVAGRPADLKTRHLLTTSVIEENGDREATGRHYCLVFASGAEFDPSKPIVREYRDRYRLTGEGWRIASRTVFTPFAG